MNDQTKSIVDNINERFSRLIRNFGANNVKGTERYEFEVEMAYLLNEVSLGPVCLLTRNIELAHTHVEKLAKRIRQLRNTAK